MNGKKAKLLRKWSSKTNTRLKVYKRVYNLLDKLDKELVGKQIDTQLRSQGISIGK